MTSSNGIHKPLVDYRKACSSNWVLRAKADIHSVLGKSVVCDARNAQVLKHPNGAAVFIKTTNAHTNAVTFYKLGYRVDPATGAATCVEDIVVPGYPRP